MKSPGLILEWDQAILTSTWSIRMKGQLLGKLDSNYEKVEIQYFPSQLNRTLWQHSHHIEITGNVRQDSIAEEFETDLRQF